MHLVFGSTFSGLEFLIIHSVSLLRADFTPHKPYFSFNFASYVKSLDGKVARA